MKLIANHKFASRLLGALWLVLVVPPGHLAFACQLMNEGPRRDCCCPEEIAGACIADGYCDRHLAGNQRGCCVVLVQPGYTATPFVSNHATDSLTLPRPVFGIPVSSHLTLQTLQRSAVPRSLIPVARSGQTIYLTTGRLRI